MSRKNLVLLLGLSLALAWLAATTFSLAQLGPGYSVPTSIMTALTILRVGLPVVAVAGVLAFYKRIGVAHALVRETLGWAAGATLVLPLINAALEAHNWPSSHPTISRAAAGLFAPALAGAVLAFLRVRKKL